MSTIPDVPVSLSGERFSVVYRLKSNPQEAYDKALDICQEQTVEFPVDLLPGGDIRAQVLGRLESLTQLDETTAIAEISYAVETTGLELVQLLNVLFGNSSMKPGIRVQEVRLSPTLLRSFRGPRFGQSGLREMFHAPTRPLLCTALKPMGLSPQALADQAYRCALGGIDIIKDDHGLADQSFATFRERALRCAEAVAEANHRTGMRCVYAPNVSAPADRVLEYAHYAKSVGAGALLVAPGLVGADTVRLLASDDTLALPILAHPALQGSFVTCPDSGMSHGMVFGFLPRLMGADATIYPNYGGRFAFTRDECREIADACNAPLGTIRTIFPTPGGGMSLERVPEMLALYGRDVIFLIGGGLHRRSDDLIENSRFFRAMAEQM